MIRNLARVFTFPFLSFHSAHGQEFELSISEHQDSKKSSIQKCESPFNGCDPTVLFITDAASYNRRSCQLKQGGPVAAPTLAPSSCVDMSRCSISRSHSRGRGICVLFLSIWYTPHTHDISSYPLYPKLETMEKAAMVRVILITGECRIIIGSVYQWSHCISFQNSLESSRINWNDPSSLNILTRQIVPFKISNKNSRTVPGSSSIWSSRRADCKWSLSPCSHLYSCDVGYYMKGVTWILKYTRISNSRNSSGPRTWMICHVKLMSDLMIYGSIWFPKHSKKPIVS